MKNEIVPTLLSDTIIGIDVGIKDLAICSNGLKFININKSKKVKRISKRLKHYERKSSRKYRINKQCNAHIKTQNIIKAERKVASLHRRLKYIRNNHLHDATSTIVRTKPCRVVMETLNISGMMKNKHLSKAIAEQCLYEFKNILRYKCLINGIEFVEADMWFPSSKMCSCCGNIKKDLKLSDRIYKCEHCGLIIDRDINASINLSNYIAVQSPEKITANITTPCMENQACGVLYQTRVASAKVDTKKQELNKLSI